MISPTECEELHKKTKLLNEIPLKRVGSSRDCNKTAS